MTYLIRFDAFDGAAPQFAEWTEDVGVWEMTHEIANATRFPTWDAADRALWNAAAAWDIEVASVVEADTLAEVGA